MKISSVEAKLFHVDWLTETHEEVNSLFLQFREHT